jgi:hypothetical protein
MGVTMLGAKKIQSLCNSFGEKVGAKDGGVSI